MSTGISVERKRHFLKTCEELVALLASTEDYTVLQLSRVLRQLLLERDPLINQVNREHRLRIEFEVPVEAGPRGTHLWMVRWPADPRVGVTEPVHRMGRDEFLRTTVLGIDGSEFTVGEIIKFTAHVRGGVHPGEPKTEAERLLLNACEMFLSYGFSPDTALLRAAAVIVLRAVEPLLAAVRPSLSDRAAPFVRVVEAVEHHDDKPTLASDHRMRLWIGDEIHYSPIYEDGRWLHLVAHAGPEPIADCYADLLGLERVGGDAIDAMLTPELPKRLFWTANLGAGRQTAHIGREASDQIDTFRTVGADGDTFGLAWGDGRAWGSLPRGDYVARIVVGSLSQPVTPVDVVVRLSFSGGNDLAATVERSLRKQVDGMAQGPRDGTGVPPASADLLLDVADARDHNEHMRRALDQFTQALPRDRGSLRTPLADFSAADQGPSAIEHHFPLVAHIFDEHPRAWGGVSPRGETEAYLNALARNQREETSLHKFVLEQASPGDREFKLLPVGVSLLQRLWGADAVGNPTAHDETWACLDEWRIERDLQEGWIVRLYRGDTPLMAGPILWAKTAASVENAFQNLKEVWPQIRREVRQRHKAIRGEDTRLDAEYKRLIQKLRHPLQLPSLPPRTCSYLRLARGSDQ